MALAAQTFDEAKKLIDRSIVADATSPPGTGGGLALAIDKHNTLRRLHN